MQALFQFLAPVAKKQLEMRAADELHSAAASSEVLAIAMRAVACPPSILSEKVLYWANEGSRQLAARPNHADRQHDCFDLWNGCRKGPPTFALLSESGLGSCV